MDNVGKSKEMLGNPVVIVGEKVGKFVGEFPTICWEECWDSCWMGMLGNFLCMHICEQGLVSIDI